MFSVRSILFHIHSPLVTRIQALHKAGLVHRDVKPPNIVFSEAQRRFKLIDLGACADLRSGTNYIPDESILDPMYCPPEQVCPPPPRTRVPNPPTRGCAIALLCAAPCHVHTVSTLRCSLVAIAPGLTVGLGSAHAYQ